jgi:nickel transport protein
MSSKIRKLGEALRAAGIITLIAICALALLFIMGASAHAHGVYIFAWVERDTVHTDSYYSSEEKVKDGVIKVFGSSGDILLEGKTDANGEFSFKIPGKPPLRIVLETGMGHRSEFLLELDDRTGIEETPTPPDENKDHQGPSTSPSREDVNQIRKVVEETLDTRLKPITKALAEIERDKGPGLTEIIAGIGYIVGIMGIILYFRTKKKP